MGMSRFRAPRLGQFVAALSCLLLTPALATIPRQAHTQSRLFDYEEFVARFELATSSRPKGAVAPTCRVAEGRCMGAMGKPSVSWMPCCSSHRYVCRHVPEKGWGKHCVKKRYKYETSEEYGKIYEWNTDGTYSVVEEDFKAFDRASMSRKKPANRDYDAEYYMNRKCTKTGERCMGAKHMPFVRYSACCDDTKICATDNSLGWGKFCVEKLYPEEAAEENGIVNPGRDGPKPNAKQAQAYLKKKKGKVTAPKASKSATGKCGGNGDLCWKPFKVGPVSYAGQTCCSGYSCEDGYCKPSEKTAKMCVRAGSSCYDEFWDKYGDRKAPKYCCEGLACHDGKCVSPKTRKSDEAMCMKMDEECYPAFFRYGDFSKRKACCPGYECNGGMCTMTMKCKERKETCYETEKGYVKDSVCCEGLKCVDFQCVPKDKALMTEEEKRPLGCEAPGKPLAKDNVDLPPAPKGGDVAYEVHVVVDPSKVGCSTTYDSLPLNDAKALKNVICEAASEYGFDDCSFVDVSPQYQTSRMADFPIANVLSRQNRFIAVEITFIINGSAEAAQALEDFLNDLFGGIFQFNVISATESPLPSDT